MTWFRRAREAVLADPEPDTSDDPATLRVTLLSQVRAINANAGRMPGEAVVTARRITDVLRDVIDTSEVRPLDIHTLVSVKGILNDYLPTTIAQFLALDPATLSLGRPSGRTPTESLIEQLDAMLDASAAVLVASRAQDADALLAQGSFLRTKFTRSDLDL